MDRQHSVTACLVAVALVGMVAGASGAALASDDPSRSATGTAPQLSGASASGQAAVAGPQAQTDNTIDITHEFRLTPSEPGRIEIHWQFDIPDNVANMTVRKPPEATNIDVDGFVENRDTLFWADNAQRTTTPTVTFSVRANETTADGGLKYADTGDWALVKRPPLASLKQYFYSGTQPSVTRTNVTAGEGVTADAMVYMGSYDMLTRSAHGQQFRLVIPEAATVTEEPADIFDSVMTASNDLRVGDRDSQVTMFAAPTSVSWGVAGIQRGDDAFYTVANQSVDEPDNTWLHEYVHTRQAFETTNATRWFSEASAEYYAAQLTLQQGRIDFRSFSDSLGVGADRRFDDVVLANPDSWHDSANYNKGGLVAGDIDRRIRLASDSGASLQAVFQRLNGHGSPVTHRTFVGAVEAAGGASVADTARRFTETTDGPEMWSQRQHDDAFGDLPAQFSFAFPERGSDGFGVRGPFRNGTAPADGLVTGETLVADIAVENVGGTEGTYDLTVTRDGVPVANRTGTVAAGERATERVGFEFAEPGTYRLSTGSDSHSVRVETPATPVVTEVLANRTTVAGGGAVRVTAVVSNRADRPASGTVTLRRGSTTLVERPVSLGVGEATDLVVTTRLTETGTTTFSAGNRSVTVTVGDGSTGTPSTDGGGGNDENDDDTAGANGPGFGLVGTLVALAALLVVARRVE